MFQEGSVGKLNHSGFTLIETLVAVIVLSICIVVIMQVFSSGLKALPSTQNYLKAFLYARNKMEQVLLTGNFQQGESSGSQADGTFSWQMNISEESFDTDDEESDQSSGKTNKGSSNFLFYRIDLSVFWHQGDKEKNYSLSTLVTKEK